MSDVNTFNYYALELLAACVSALDGTATGAPARSFVSPGLPALDCCPQLTVHATSLGEDNSSPVSPAMVQGHRPRLMKVNLASYLIIIARCVPIGAENSGVYRPPDPAGQEAVAAVCNADIFAIWNYLYWLKRHSVDAFNGYCETMYLGTAIPLDTSGGCGGWTLPVSFQIDGYDAYIAAS